MRTTHCGIDSFLFQTYNLRDLLPEEIKSTFSLSVLKLKSINASLKNVHASSSGISKQYLSYLILLQTFVKLIPYSMVEYMRGSHMSCISCISYILEKLENCPVFSCIQLICPVLSRFLRYIAYQNESCLFYSLKNVLLIEKTINNIFQILPKYYSIVSLLQMF